MALFAKIVSPFRCLQARCSQSEPICKEREPETVAVCKPALYCLRATTHTQRSTWTRRWSPRERIELSQILATRPNPRPCQLPWVGKWVSSSAANPMRSIWANNKGTSSTRSVIMLGFSFIPRA